jgi:hypothetical protein
LFDERVSNSIISTLLFKFESPLLLSLSLVYFIFSTFIVSMIYSYSVFSTSKYFLWYFINSSNSSSVISSKSYFSFPSFFYNYYCCCFLSSNISLNRGSFLIFSREAQSSKPPKYSTGSNPNFSSHFSYHLTIFSRFWL